MPAAGVPVAGIPAAGIGVLLILVPKGPVGFLGNFSVLVDFS
jgi:hypothetical protein